MAALRREMCPRRALLALQATCGPRLPLDRAHNLSSQATECVQGRTRCPETPATGAGDGVGRCSCPASRSSRWSASRVPPGSVISFRTLHVPDSVESSPVLSASACGRSLSVPCWCVPYANAAYRPRCQDGTSDPLLPTRSPWRVRRRLAGCTSENDAVVEARSAWAPVTPMLVCGVPTYLRRCVIRCIGGPSR
jgi:hypothetical protein